jgi:hypothetical protein
MKNIASGIMKFIGKQNFKKGTSTFLNANSSKKSVTGNIH